MGSSPNLIQVGAVFDSAQLNAAMKQAAAATEEALARMQAAFTELQATTSARISQLEARLAELEAAHVKHLGGAHQAVGGLKLAFEDAGVAVNRHVARWLATLPALGAVFAAAFPVFAIISFADSLFKAGEKMDTHSEKMAKMVRESLDLTLSFDKQAESIQITNLKLEDHIATLQRKPTQNGIAIAALEAKRALEELIKSFQDAIAKENELLAGQKQGFFNKLLHGDSGINDVLAQINEFHDKIEETATRLRLASKEGNKQQTADYKAELDAQNAEYRAFLNGQIAANDKARQEKIAGIKTETELINKVNNLTLTSAQFEDQISRNVKAVNNEYEKRDQTLRSLLILIQGEAQAEVAIAKHGDLLKQESASESAKKILEAYTLLNKHLVELKNEAVKKNAEVGKQEDKEAIDGIDRRVKAILKGLEQEVAASDEIVKGLIEQAREQEKIEEQLIEQRFLKGKITQQQEIDLIAHAKQAELAEEVKYDQELLALWHKDEKEKIAIINAITKAQQQSAIIGTKAVTDGLKAQQQQYRQIFEQIGNSFKTEVMSLLQGTQSVAQGFAQMFNSIIGDLVGFVEKWVAKKLEMWLIDKLFNVHHAASAAAAAAGVSSAMGFASVMAALPFPVNVSVAPGVAAAAGASAGALGAAGAAGAAAFELGGIVPQTGLILAHRGETVLPASMSGTGNFGAAAHFHFSPVIQAFDATGLDAVLTKQRNTFEKHVTRSLKRRGLKG